MLGIKYGETCPLKFACKDKQGNPIDLTNCKILFELYDEVTDEEPIISKAFADISDELNNIGSISNPTQGKFFVIFTDEDYTKLYKGRVYYLTVWLIKNNCKKIISSSNNDLCPFTIFYP